MSGATVKETIDMLHGLGENFQNLKIQCNGEYFYFEAKTIVINGRQTNTVELKIQPYSSCYDR